MYKCTVKTYTYIGKDMLTAHLYMSRNPRGKESPTLNDPSFFARCSFVNTTYSQTFNKI